MTDYTPLTIFALATTALQIAIGWSVATRRRSLSGTLIGVLFVLNGLVSFGVAMVSMGDTSRLFSHPFWVSKWSSAFDAPTGFLMFLLAAGILHNGGMKRWPTSITIPFLAVIPAMVFFVFLQLSSDFGESAFFRILYVQIPVVAGYSLITIALTRVFIIHYQGEHGGMALLLWLGFCARPIEFAVRFALDALLDRRPGASDSGWWFQIENALYWVLVASCTISLVLILARLWGRREPEMRRMLSLVIAVVGLAIALGGEFAFRIDSSLRGTPVGQYALTVMTLVLIRPLIVGMALLPKEMPRIIGTGGVAVASWLLSKLTVVAVTNTDFFSLGRVDAISTIGAIGLFVVFLPFFRGVGQTVGAGKGLVGKTKNPTNAEIVISQLTSVAKSVSGGWQSQAEVAEATGIGRNNVADAVRRANGRLDDSGLAVRIEERIVGVRGRKQYRLHPAADIDTLVASNDTSATRADSII